MILSFWRYPPTLSVNAAERQGPPPANSAPKYDSFYLVGGFIARLLWATAGSLQSPRGGFLP